MSSIDHVAQQYRSLCLTGVAEHLEQLLSQAEANQSSYLHFAEALAGQEKSQRNTKRIEQNKRRAGFPLHKTLEEFDYRFQTTISKREINSLLDFGFIDNRENVVFIGAPGVGKTCLWPSAWESKPSTPATRSVSTPLRVSWKLWNWPNLKAS